jgi:hypothetical protein
MTTPPPVPPKGSSLIIDKDGNLAAQIGYKNWWRTPAATATVQALDQTGRRVTLTRAVTIGVFALGAKKRTGKVAVVLAAPDGATHTHQVPAKLADQTLAWAVAFNAWRDAVGSA